MQRQNDEGGIANPEGIESISPGFPPKADTLGTRVYPHDTTLKELHPLEFG